MFTSFCVVVEMAQELSSNEEEYQPSRVDHPLPDMDVPSGIIGKCARKEKRETDCH